MEFGEKWIEEILENNNTTDRQIHIYIYSIYTVDTDTHVYKMGRRWFCALEPSRGNRKPENGSLFWKRTKQNKSKRFCLLCVEAVCVKLLFGIRKLQDFQDI